LNWYILGIPDKEKEHLSQKWDKKSYENEEYPPELLEWEKQSREKYLTYIGKNNMRPKTENNLS
jgi:hypothetical protein